MISWIGNIGQDLRFALRGWGRSPSFALGAVATLALGIGANTAIFSVVSGVLLRPLPYADPERLVQVFERQPPGPGSVGFDGPVSRRDFLEFRAHSKAVRELATYSLSSRNFAGSGDPANVTVVTSERGLFRLLGVAPLTGRTFADGDPASVAVASWQFWRTHLGADPSAIGRSIPLEGQTFTLIGIMPEQFRFPYRGASIDLWLPWDLPSTMGPNSRLDAVVGRLQPGVAMEAARQEMNSMSGPAESGREVRLRSLKEEVVGKPARESLLVLMGAVGMVLLVACVNVANLLMARTASRRQEIAIRTALGAGRLRLIGQFLTESLLLSLGGGLAGLALGILGRRLLVGAAAEQLPRAAEIGLDWRVFAFLLAVCVAAGIAFGLAPAIAAARGGSAALKTRGVGSAVRDGLVVAEVALAFILLAGAGLLIRTFLNLQSTGAGVNAENVLTVHVVITKPQEAMAIEERVSQIPGVTAAGFISLLPLQNSGWSGGFTIEGRPGIHTTELRYITPGYFRAMGIPLRRGREFTPHDTADLPRMILVNEVLARQHFPNEDPVGRKLDRGIIIGVVGDVRQASLNVEAKPEVYYTVAQNFAQIRRHGSTLVLRSSRPPESLAGDVRAAIREVLPNEALFQIAPMRQVIASSLALQRLHTWLLGLFAAIGTLLAVAGIYGVIAYLVTLRAREFGIRMALGADASRVVRHVIGRGAALVAGGLVLGMAGAAALTRVLSGVLYGVSATDPPTFAGMAILLALVALAACMAPARRAARVDPSTALRCE